MVHIYEDRPVHGVIIYVPTPERFREAVEEYESNKAVSEIRLDPKMCEAYLHRLGDSAKFRGAAAD